MRYVLLVVASFLLVAPAAAQIVNPGQTGDVTFDAQNCQGGTSMISIFDFQAEGATSFSFGLTIDGNTRRFTLDSEAVDVDELNNSDVNDGQEALNQISDPDWRSFVQFFLRELGCLTGGVFGSTQAVTSDPLVNQSIQTFQTIAFAQRAVPRAAAPDSPQARQRADDAAPGDAVEEEEGGGSVRLRQVSSDVEYEFFDLNNFSGENLALRFGYAQTSGSGRWTYGLNGIYNRLTFDGADPFNNGSVNVFIDRVTRSTLDRETSWGLSASYLFFDGSDSGFGVALHTVRRWYPGSGGTLFALGTMGQFTQVGDLQNAYVNVAVLLGVPIGRRLAFNVDALLLWNALQAFDGEIVELDDPYVLNPGAYLTVLLGDAFALNVGGRTVLLIKDYSSYELTLGAGFRF